MKLKIFGIVIPVYEKPIIETLGLAGYYDPKQKNIVIDSTMTDEEKLSTLLHELVHAASFRLGWRQALPPLLEETMCEQISTLIIENFFIKAKNENKLRPRRTRRTHKSTTKSKKSK